MFITSFIGNNIISFQFEHNTSGYKERLHDKNLIEFNPQNEFNVTYLEVNLPDCRSLLIGTYESSSNINDIGLGYWSK